MLWNKMSFHKLSFITFLLVGRIIKKSQFISQIATLIEQLMNVKDCFEGSPYGKHYVGFLNQSHSFSAIWAVNAPLVEKNAFRHTNLSSSQNSLSNIWDNVSKANFESADFQQYKFWRYGRLPTRQLAPQVEAGMQRVTHVLPAKIHKKWKINRG